jgi:hypothetical protein
VCRHYPCGWVFGKSSVALDTHFVAAMTRQWAPAHMLLLSALKLG